MIKDTPAMGWNSWNTFGPDIDEKVIMETADAMVESGLLEAGYDYLVIDDCWHCKKRDSERRLKPNPEKFPHGMKYVSDYVHSKGLKFGIYSCAGSHTCAGYPGSFEYEFIDAQTFAEWGVDFLKYDYCFRPTNATGHTLYKRMGTALANCGRDILFSACSWGVDDTKEWIKTTGAHIWRSTPDIFDTFDSIKEIFAKQEKFQPYNGKGCFNDMDMLVVGMHGKGFAAKGGCTKAEYRTHFSIWALLNSPLMIGCDVRKMDDETKEILMNKDVIAINQDIGGHQPYTLTPRLQPFSVDHDAVVPVWFKLLDNGDYAIGMFNMDDKAHNMWFTMDDLGMNRSTGKVFELKNLWTGETEEMCNGLYKSVIEPHDCRLFRARFVNE